MRTTPARYRDPAMLALAVRIGDLLATENEKGTFTPRLDSNWDTYMWLEAYRLIETDLIIIGSLLTLWVRVYSKRF